MTHLNIKMPVTRNLIPENTAPEECDEQICLIGNIHATEECVQTQALDNTDEVSSTTVDSDPIAGPNRSTTVCMDITDNAHPDSLKDQSASFDESASNPSSSTATGVANISRGFQDAFAAFASASCRDIQEEENQMDVSVSNSTSEHVAIADSSVVEPIISSLDDSSQVTTTGESFVPYEADAGNVYSDTTDIKEDDAFHKIMSTADPDTDSQSSLGEEQAQAAKLAAQAQLGEPNQTEAAVTSESVYFIQTTDAAGQVVTSIIDPNDIPSYSDSVVYKQCMKADGEIETTIVYSGGATVSQEEPSQEQEVNSGEAEIQQGEQIIYAHDISGQLTPIDSIESANDVAPPGKQFVYMQDSTGRIIRTVMDASQTMVPGQQVYYTQSDDGRIITSVMDSTATLVSEDSNQEQQSLQTGDQVCQQQMGEASTSQQQQEASSSMVGRTSAFNIDNSMSGLSMLAELSHLTAGQATTPGPVTELRAASSTDSSNSNDMEEFRPVAMVTRRLTNEDGVESVGSEIAELKVGETDSDSFDQPSLLQGDGAGPGESIIARIVSQMKGEQAQPSYTVSRDNLFVQWQNLDAMCWMDVVLIMLVYSPTLRPLVNLDPNHELASTLLITLLKANRQAQVLLQNLLKKNNGAVISDVQTGAGNLASIQDPKTSKLVCKENMDEIGKAINILYAMREKIWQGLQPRLRCERGKHNSPVLVLPLLVREKPDIKQMFTMSYRYVFKCEKCSYSQDDRHTKILPSIPAVPDDFNMKEPCFVRNCFECKAPNQRMMMKFEQLQDFVQMHFVKGLPHSRFEELSFDFNNDHYEVTTVVHYKNNPDHFIAWVRNAPGPAWMECDDLKSVITRYLHTSPNIPPSQVHMVMWERRLTPQHTLIMRDTEDTKLLASLVLTVQQPNVHQPTEAETRPAAIPGTTTATTTTQSLPTNLLSGLMAQTFTPYTPRGKGRGKGNRGACSSRGRAVATTTTPVIRRASPIITQALSPSVASSPQSTTSPQIVRLPLSALASSGLNFRGSTPGGARYVLVGNSFQAGAAASSALSRAGTPSKVVVVRSQGGASNISAAQLLQLLQRTGAISQVGTRFTTTMTTPAATSFVIQQDGSITTTTVSKDASVSYPTAEQSAETPMETETINGTQSSSEQTPSASLGGQTISTLAYSGTGIATSDQTSHHTPSSEPNIHAAASQTETANTINEDSPGELPGVGGQTVAISQQPGRYIQIPNPAGSGMLMCMVGMRDGKIVLVPVDKNTQTKVAGQSLLKVSNTSATSPKISIHAAGSTQQAMSVSSAGSVLAQLQKQLVQAQNTSSATSASPRFITLPATSGNKRIQLITVPRGQADSPVPKTVITSSQHMGSNTASSISTRLVSVGETTSAQSSNIVIREVKRPEANNITTLPTSLCTTDIVCSSEQLVSTPAVSLLKDVSARLSASTTRTSLLASLTEQQKPQENFRYILPGSSTTHILHTGPSGVQAGLSQAGRIFTALSSSGTIIGGQLTASPGGSSTVGTSTVDPDMTVGDSDDSSHTTSILSAKRRLSKQLDTTEYIPLGSNRGRGPSDRGRGARGRSQLWNSDAELIVTAPAKNQQMSTLADLRQIGAHIIEAGSEAVDGIPVVSIPDYSTEGASQTEILSAAHSIISEINSGSISQNVSSLSHAIQDTEQESTADQEPRVIAQAIPSMNVNHGFDILTQGILGSGNAARQSPHQKQARSLLTGAKTTLQSASSLLASLSETTASSLASSAAVQTIGQTEIETLMQAAQAAARPNDTRSQITTSQLTDGDFNLDGPLSYNDNAMNGQERDIAEESHYEDEKSMSTQFHPEAEQDISEHMSIDDNQVSAAERYRMPVELFQPDEESPEKSMKADDINRIAVSLSPRLFHNSGDAPHQDEICTHLQNKDAIQEPMIRKPPSPNNEHSSRDETTTEDLASPPGSVSIEAIENMGSICESASNELLGLQDEVQPKTRLTQNKVSTPKKGRQGSASKHGGRRKLVASSVLEPIETSKCLSDETLASETVVTYGSSPEKGTQMSSPVKESRQYSASIEDLATDSVMESDELADKWTSELKGEDDVEGSLFEIEREKIVTPRKSGRPRRRTKGSGGRRKLGNTSVHEHAETDGTSQSEVTSVIDTVVSHVTAESSERFIQASSPEKEHLQPSSSIEDIATNSLIESDEVAENPIEEDEDTIDDIQDNDHDEMGIQKTLTRRKAVRHRGTTKSRGRRKSKMSSAPAETVVPTQVTADAETISGVMSSSSPEIFIQPSSQEKESYQPVTSIEEFVTDSLMQQSNKPADTAMEILSEELMPSGFPIDILRDRRSEEARPDTSLTVKKDGRPKRWQRGTQKCNSEPATEEANYTFLSDTTSASEIIHTVSSEASPERKSIELFRSENEILQNLSSPKSVVTDSLMEPDDKPKEALKSDAADVYHNPDETGHDTNLTPKKACRSRGRSKGSSGKHGGRWKSVGRNDPEETIDTGVSEATSVLKLDLSGSSLDGTFTGVSSPEKGSLKLSSSTDPAIYTVSEARSIEHIFTASLMGSAEVTPEKLNGSDDVAVFQDGCQLNEVGHNANFTPDNAGKRNGKRKGSSRERRGRRKSGGTSVPEPEETVGVCPLDVTSGPPKDANFTQISSSHIFSINPDASKIVSFGEVLTDLLIEYNHSAADKPKEVLESDHLRDIHRDISKQITVSPTKRKKNMKKVAVESTFIKIPAASPAFVQSKKKANWDVSSCPVAAAHPGSSFSYKVLSGRPVASHARHPSLGPVQDSFTSPPSPLPPPCKSQKSYSPELSSPALVIRKRPKLQLASKGDSPNRPTVIPLIMKDAACTGGSVVTTPSGGEIFTGVLVDHKQAKADWSCSGSEQEEVLEYVTEEELKAAQRRYCKQLMTVFYMKAGDFSAAIGLSSSYQQTEIFRAEERMTKEITTSIDDKTGDSDEAVGGLEINSEQSDRTPTSNIEVRQTKRQSISSESSISSQSAKRAKFLQDEESSHIQSLSESINTSSVATPSPINGIDNETSSAILSQSASYSEQIQIDDQRDATSTTATPSFSFPSPTRRSGRTPIPSKKVLDALEDTPFLSSLKIRRVSSVSSDDTQSGYTSDDMPQKKGNIT